MPDEDYCASFFHPEGVLDRLLDASGSDCNMVEFGCGYGTFTLPAAKRTRGLVTALDIEPAMVRLVAQRAKAESLSNVHAEVRDFVEHGTGLADRSQGHAMVFNLLHIEAPVALIREAFRVLQPGGVLSVIHWRSDIEGFTRFRRIFRRPTGSLRCARIGQTLDCVHRDLGLLAVRHTCLFTH
ncbi:MAG TPA: methyltransferase type 11 [Comamonadaceae bacterium]|nr:methyltransferase type 11 [Comamonadaceae bacterium]